MRMRCFEKRYQDNISQLTALFNLHQLSFFKYNLKQSKQTVMNINFEKGGNVIQNMKPNFHYY